MKKAILLLLLSPLVLAYQNQTFDWIPPTENVDGSPLANADIIEYRVYCNNTLLGVVPNTNGTDTWTSPDGSLPPGDYACFGTAVSDAGESDESNIVNFTVDPAVPKAPTGFSVTFP